MARVSSIKKWQYLGKTINVFTAQVLELHRTSHQYTYIERSNLTNGGSRIVRVHVVSDSKPSSGRHIDPLWRRKCGTSIPNILDTFRANILKTLKLL